LSVLTADMLFLTTIAMCKFLPGVVPDIPEV